jgi:hypothetical protein
MSSNQVASTVSTNLLPVQAQYNANNVCTNLIGQGGNQLVAPINASSLSLNGNLFATTSVLPVVSAGFGTNPTVTAVSTFAFKIVVGTGGAANGTITLPAAPNGWLGFAADVTSGSTLFLQLTGSTSTTITFTSYSVTTGLAANMSAGDVVLVNAIAY